MIEMTSQYNAVLMAGSEDDNNRYVPPEDAPDKEAYHSNDETLEAVHMQEQPHAMRMK